MKQNIFPTRCQQASPPEEPPPQTATVCFQSRPAFARAPPGSTSLRFSFFSSCLPVFLSAYCSVSLFVFTFACAPSMLNWVFLKNSFHSTIQFYKGSGSRSKDHALDRALLENSKSILCCILHHPFIFQCGTADQTFPGNPQQSEPATLINRKQRNKKNHQLPKIDAATGKVFWMLALGKT